MPEADGKYRGPFCTGHTFFPMTAVNFYTETLNHEFREEYKQAHNVPKEDVRDTEVPVAARRAKPVNLPLSGTPTARVIPGGRPGRTPGVSSSTIGGWWSDPIFADGVGGKGVPRPEKTGADLATSSDIGKYWTDPTLNKGRDEHLETLRVKVSPHSV